ncbi:MAG TPA: hypothetical protein VF538_07485 [Pyrinomonadaceae bacterium]|jgi:hypothetical protein
MKIPKLSRPLFLLAILLTNAGCLPGQCLGLAPVAYEAFGYSGDHAPPLTARQANQHEPDLSGTYSLDESKSDAMSGVKFDYTKLDVVQRGSEIKFIRRQGIGGGKELPVTATLYADGRGEKLLLLQGVRQVNSKTKWEGDKLVTRYTVKHIYGGRFINYDVIEVWELSKDGKTLTHDTKAVALQNNSPGKISVTQPNPETKEIFRRVSN